MNWQELEDKVRKIAESHWRTPANPETLAGVKCDAVLRPSQDEIIAIEITQERNLAKLRIDLAKLATIKSAFVPEGIVVRSYFVSAHEVSSLRASGQAQKVEVLDLREFREKFVGKEAYEFQRRKVEFGSALDPETNKGDEGKFVETGYRDRTSSRTYEVEDIAKEIASGRKIILLGEFGTGKSRCAKEVYEKISGENILFPTLAINLRDHWGHQKSDIIIRSHLSSLGLSDLEDRVVRLCLGGHISLILDGFDEIGSQSWSGEPERLKEIRRRSLVGVRDIVSKVGESGLLISGRDHYFSNDDEMFSCLGLPETTLVLRCPEEFTESQAEDYLKKNTGLEEFPDWSPRKPLICQLFAKLDRNEMRRLIDNSEGEVGFFENTFDAICARETRIHPSIDGSVLRGVLLGIASTGRSKNEVIEEITPSEINEVFTRVSGFSPLDEAATILQRLPYLGRVSSGSGNRRFIDDYAKSGLCGISLAEAFATSDRKVAAARYVKPIGSFGAKFLGAKHLIGPDPVKYVKLCTSHGNTQIAADYLCSLVAVAADEVDMTGIAVLNANIDNLQLADLEVHGLDMSSTFVDTLEMDGARFAKSSVRDCVFQHVVGVSDANRLPECFDESCVFGDFSSVENVARISELPLTNAQKTLIAIIRKLFFQPGRGRMEEALLRGTSSYWDSAAAETVVRYMIRSGIIIESQGRHGTLYIPDRKHTRRMGRIRSLLANSNDELWNLF